MKKIFLACMIVLIVGCSSLTQISTDLPYATQTNTPVSTATPKPATPTVTPFPPLQTNGPYFSYFRKIGEEYQLVMLDSDGKGRKEISFPQEIQDAITRLDFSPNMRFVSPNGTWMAFFTGRSSDFNAHQGLQPYKLNLNIFNLKTGKIEVVIPLLSKDYPNNFTEAEKQIGQPQIKDYMLQGTFDLGITKSIAWSPDGRYLAFAGQMEGLSSDLYIYDVETKEIRRLSNELQQLQWVSWSPDGKMIIYGSSFALSLGMNYDIYMANLDGTTNIQINTLTSGVINWLNFQKYFEYEHKYEVGSNRLRLIDIAVGKSYIIWAGSFDSYTIDKANEWVALSAITPDIDPLSTGTTTNTTPGLYLVNLLSFEKTKIELPSNDSFLSYSIYPFGVDDKKFILISETSSSYFLLDDLQLTPIDIKDIKILVSPNNNFYAGISEKGVNIYSSDNTLLNSFNIPIAILKRSHLEWSPNSNNLFLIDEANIYSIEIASGKIEKIEANLLYEYNYKNPSYQWIEIP